MHEDAHLVTAPRQHPEELPPATPESSQLFNQFQRITISLNIPFRHSGLAHEDIATVLKITKPTGHKGDNFPMNLVSKFAEYLSRNPHWGVFHYTLEPGDYDSSVDPANFARLTEEEHELIEIYNLLTLDERRELAARATEEMERMLRAA